MPALLTFTPPETSFLQITNLQTITAIELRLFGSWSYSTDNLKSYYWNWCFILRE